MNISLYIRDHVCGVVTCRSYFPTELSSFDTKSLCLGKCHRFKGPWECSVTSPGFGSVKRENRVRVKVKQGKGALLHKTGTDLQRKMA